MERVPAYEAVDRGSTPLTRTRPHNLDDILVLGRAQSGIFVTSKLDQQNDCIL